MRRNVMRLLALVVLVGGLAACGGGGSGGGNEGGIDTTTSEQSDQGGTDSKPGGNAAITDYCDAVQQSVDKAGELQADPSNSALKTEVTDLGIDVGTMGGELAGNVPSFSAAENEEYQGCGAEFTTASLTLLDG